MLVLEGLPSILHWPDFIPWPHLNSRAAGRGHPDVHRKKRDGLGV